MNRLTELDGVSKALMHRNTEVRMAFVGCVCECVYVYTLTCVSALLRRLMFSCTVLSTEQAENPAVLPTCGDRETFLYG